MEEKKECSSGRRGKEEEERGRGDQREEKKDRLEEGREDEAECTKMKMSKQKCAVCRGGAVGHAGGA